MQEGWAKGLIDPYQKNIDYGNLDSISKAINGHRGMSCKISEEDDLGYYYTRRLFEDESLKEVCKLRTEQNRSLLTPKNFIHAGYWNIRTMQAIRKPAIAAREM